MLRKIAGILFLIVLALFMFVVWLQNYYVVSNDAPNGEMVLEVWNKPPSRQVKELQLWKETVLRFEQENPTIKIRGVEREFLPQDFVTAMAGGKGPDLMHVWIGMLPTLVRENFVAPMDEYIQNWNQKDYIPPIVWEPTKLENKTYGIPRDTYFMVLFYRKDLFRRAGLNPDQPPRNWAELAEDARRLTKPKLGLYGLGLAPTTWTFMDFVWQNGGELVSRDQNGVWHTHLDSPAVLETLQYWHELKWKYRVLPPNDLTSAEDVAQMFALGKVGMMLGVAMQLPTLINKYGLNFQDTGIAPLPAGPKGLQASHAGGEVFIINASIPKRKRDAAWKYIQFELSPANQLWKWVRMNELGMTIFPGAFSASTNLLNMPEFAMVKEELQHVRNEPHLPEWPLIKDALDNEPLQAVFIDKHLNLKTTLAAFNRRLDERFLHTGEAPAMPAMPEGLTITASGNTAVAAAK